MLKSMTILLALVLAGCDMGVGPSISNPRLLRSTNEIQEELTRDLPKGTSREEVVSYFGSFSPPQGRSPSKCNGDISLKTCWIQISRGCFYV
jgi:hypothetical protein